MDYKSSAQALDYLYVPLTPPTRIWLGSMCGCVQYSSVSVDFYGATREGKTSNCIIADETSLSLCGPLNLAPSMV